MNLSGLGFNKAFKTGIDPKKPYYYITGSLDLSGAVFGGTYFFNFDNSFKYASERDYANFITIDENSVISEVLVYTDPDLEAVGDQEQVPVYLSIGGADYNATAPNNAVKVWWAAPAGFGPYQWASLSSISQVSRDAFGIATITTSTPHGLIPGQLINISVDAPDAAYSDTGVSPTIISPTQFSYANAGPADFAHAATGFVEFDLGSNQPFFNGYPLSLFESSQGPVNLFGHEGGHFPYFYNPVADAEDLSNKYKYLAVTILDELPEFPQFPLLDAFQQAPQDQQVQQQAPQDQQVQQQAPQDQQVQQQALPQLVQLAEEEYIIINEDSIIEDSRAANKLLNVAARRKQVQRNRKLRSKGLPTGEPAILKGKLTVTIKVYPKNQ